MNNSSTKCPVCSYDLELTPWSGSSPSDEICPSCGIHFGYDDWRLESREEVYAAWREKWIRSGKPWFSNTRKSKKWSFSMNKYLRKILIAFVLLVLFLIFSGIQTGKLVGNPDYSEVTPDNEMIDLFTENRLDFARLVELEKNIDKESEKDQQAICKNLRFYQCIEFEYTAGGFFADIIMSEGGGLLRGFSKGYVWLENPENYLADCKGYCAVVEKNTESIVLDTSRRFVYRKIEDNWYIYYMEYAY